MNTMTYEKLQYIQLKEMVKNHCVSGLGKALLNQLKPSSILKVVKNRLNETTEARKLTECGKPYSLERHFTYWAPYRQTGKRNDFGAVRVSGDSRFFKRLQEYQEIHDR